ncbi:TIGR03086 family metal-binding protein [Streptomyces orinoci]|uniref:TIGR03086 family metal-binding protein n=1 Tax=Streptomyces orinoci TaxID=67339 RepID=A0ABV3JRL9_STRON|nr:TIGR03086 family metal-binding protein [Streptomyces orinoci]
MTDSRRTLLARHREALDLFTERVRAIRPDQWRRGTPCSEWTVRDLVNHLTVEQLWVPPLLDGASIEEIGDSLSGDRLGKRPAAAWAEAAEAAHAAFAARGALGRTVELSYGPTGAEAYCSQMTADAIVHSWDLSRAIGAEERPSKALTEFAVREFGPYAGDLSESGVFGEPVPAPPDADAWEDLLARLGRRPRA